MDAPTVDRNRSPKAATLRGRAGMACWVLGLAPLSIEATTASEPEPPLHAWVSTSWAPPFLLPHGGKHDEPHHGLIPDWYAALSEAIGRHVKVTYVPPKRLAQDAAIHQDLRCFGAPAWVPAGTVSWYEDSAKPFLTVEEVLVGQSHSPAFSELTQLQGLRIGTVTGYAYPRLAAGFESGELHREDAPSELAMLRKQMQGRTDYAVIRRWTLQHLQHHDPQWHALKAMPVTVSRTELFCGVRRGGTLPLATLDAAQAQLLRNGTLDRLLARHGLSR